jgi:uncharacterized membrane protein required for colicin V production
MRALYSQFNSGYRALPYGLRVIALFVGSLVGKAVASLLGISLDSHPYEEALAYLGVFIVAIAASMVVVVMIQRALSPVPDQ